jgi:battenin
LQAWSSGTGMAGVFGYFWVVAFHIWLGLSFSTTILLALVFPVVLVTAFRAISFNSTETHSPKSSYVSLSETANGSATEERLSFSGRMSLMASLWPYTVPLFIVYASEYILQVGAKTFQYLLIVFCFFL